MRCVSAMLSLVVILAACTPLQVRQPPEELLRPCVDPAIETATNADLVAAILAYRLQLRLCDNDKTALREWAKN